MSLATSRLIHEQINWSAIKCAKLACRITMNAKEAEEKKRKIRSEKMNQTILGKMYLERN